MDDSQDRADTGIADAPLNPPVFYGSLILLVGIIGFAAIAPQTAEQAFNSLHRTIIANGSWYYVMVIAVILVCTLTIAFTRFGDIKLGPDHAEPEYSFVSWFAMLFAAGMGIGLMFFGVAEPVLHFLNPPLDEGGTMAAAREAMTLTFFHWGLHAWATYAVVAMMLAYFSFRHGLPLTLRSALYPLIGDRIYGPLGTAVDVFAILSTTFGVATSLGLGVEQINSGLHYLFGVPKSQWVQIVLIGVTTLLATVSVVMGLDAGIKRLSEFNIVLAIALVLGILLLGPTVYLLQMFMQNSGDYLSSLVSKTFNLYAYEPTQWIGNWTIFYWGWWISWAPFVGLFIARISKGRTIREFVVGALTWPCMFTLLWMTVFGNSAIELILVQGAQPLADAVQSDSSVALFQFLGYFPMAKVLSFLAIFMVIVFFVTSADSGAMVLNMLSSHGRDDTPMGRRVLWMALIGLTALVMLLAGGLSALQTLAIAAALPFSLVILVALIGFVKALSLDDAKRQTLVRNHQLPIQEGDDGGWRRQLRNLFEAPQQQEVNEFMRKSVLPTLQEFSQELQGYGLEARIRIAENSNDLGLTVMDSTASEFLYRVVVAPISQTPDDLFSKGYQADVYLLDGSQAYDVMGWSMVQLRNDLLEQFEKHSRFLKAQH